MDKTVEYTPELTAEISAEYTANPTRETVEIISLRIGKSTTCANGEHHKKASSH
jgi:hypothetical protein